MARLFSFLTNALLAALILGAAIPGPHRALFPKGYGLTEIAPRTWTDDPTRAADYLSLAATARTRTATFFGDEPPDPTLILCTTKACADAFRITGNGLSVSYVLVLVSPGGLTPGTLTHEMTHSRLHRALSPKTLLRPTYPAWFDEGLATYVARHPTWRGPIPAGARQRILQTRRFWEWGQTMRAIGPGPAYAAAAAEVDRIIAIAGPTGLKSLIARSETGEDFDTVLSEILNR